MTQQQWNDHQVHFADHITWPATKDQIVAACSGEDVDEEVLQEIKSTLPDDPDKTYSESELRDLLVMA